MATRKNHPITWEQLAIVAGVVAVLFGLFVGYNAIYSAGYVKGSKLPYGIYETYIECNTKAIRHEMFCNSTNVRSDPFYKGK